jgi:hypothetical protein
MASYRNGLETVCAVSYGELFLEYGLSGLYATTYARILTHL